MKIGLRSGSALLIVLGMLSFMVVSAIGFSVFMRQNRLPSSFVRRNTAANQLVKAALARAMNELDSAIADHPFPGRDPDADGSMIQPMRIRGNDFYIDDSWKGRVFAGKRRRNANPVDTSLAINSLVPYEETVSTLTMEGLAYLPPCLVNDVRYFSRHVSSASWQRLGYDAGRFAYTAVNVSDYFDVNNIPGAGARTSSPTNRISLAYMFTDEKGKFKQSGVESYQKIVNNYGPFVSLADFNLVMYNKIGNMSAQVNNLGFGSPFGDYAEGNSDFLRYYGEVYSSGNKTNMVAKTTFVTDSYFPEVEGNDELLDLSDDDCQPFSKTIIDQDQPQLVDVYMDFEKKNRKFATALRDHLGGKMGSGFVANLYDYLDYDDIPLSLALPSVEQVPMIAGFKVKEALGSMEFKFKREVVNINGVDGNFDPLSARNNRGDYAPNTDIKVISKYMLIVSKEPKLEVNVGTFFPFRHVKCPNYDIEIAANVFWGPVGGDTSETGTCEAMKMRGSIDTKDGDFLVEGLLPEQNTSSTGKDKEHNRFVFTTVKKQGNSFGGYVDTEDQAFVETTLSLNGGSMPSPDVLHPFASAIETWRFVATDSKKPDNGVWMLQNSELDKISNVYGIFKNDHNRYANCDALCPNNQAQLIKPYIAMRVLLKTSDGVVDIAPACGYDDLNNCSSLDSQHSSLVDMNRAAFILPTNGAQLKYDINTLQGFVGLSTESSTNDQKIEVSVPGTTYICPDPRWNHNVANWQKVEGSSSDIKSQVQTSVTEMFNGQKGKDPDFFMTVSNQGQLQSISELALLPRTNNFNGSDTIQGSVSINGSEDKGNFAKSLPLTKQIAGEREPKENFYICSENLDDEKSLESLFVDGTGGCRVNPYSDDPNIFKAALMYTPYDWAAAHPENEDADDFAAAIKKTFSSEANINSAKISQEEIDELAEKLQDKFASAGGDWVEAYNKLKWGFSGGSDLFSDIGLDNLTVADKKYLYGFWKGCFDARQQLFIIFVRAESAISGGGIGQGARAVAVVWRDPNPPKDGSGEYRYQPDNGDTDERIPPHKMRVLFYKALE